MGTVLDIGPDTVLDTAPYWSLEIDPDTVLGIAPYWSLDTVLDIDCLDIQGIDSGHRDSVHRDFGQKDSVQRDSVQRDFDDSTSDGAMENFGPFRQIRQAHTMVGCSRFATVDRTALDKDTAVAIAGTADTADFDSGHTDSNWPGME